MIDKVISVCSRKDAEVWEVSHKKILHNIAAKQYAVIVPEHEVAFFQSITDKHFNVVSETIYSKYLKNLKRRLPQSQMHQYGWYLQQIIKLAAIKEMSGDEVALIWDADTIPTQPLNFLGKDNLLRYYQGTEHHEPYFECIKRITGLKKIVGFSFIAQCFAIKAQWFHEFCTNIEAKHGMGWDEAILNQIDFSEDNGFSEYETLGTYISHHYSDQVEYSTRPWYRLGNSLIGHPAFLDTYLSKSHPSKYDFISFEKWDRIKPYFLKVTIPYLFRIRIPRFVSTLKSKIGIKKILDN